MKRSLKIICIFTLFAATTFITTKHKNSQVPIIKTQVEDFYFLRHGQTDQNIGKIKDFSTNIPLNQIGLQQTYLIEPIIAKLPIKTICYSPLIRTTTTKDIIADRMQVATIKIKQLQEIMLQRWIPLSELHNKNFNDVSPTIQKFVHQVAHGLKKSLLQRGPVLIIAHNGVFKAICFLLKIAPDAWNIDNCELVHCYKDHSNQWHAQSLYQAPSFQ